jgi:hypothetical protein
LTVLFLLSDGGSGFVLHGPVSGGTFLGYPRIRQGFWVVGHSALSRQVPEARIAAFGFGLSLTWEALQSPFYADTFTASWSQIAYNRVHCSIGDVLILLVAFWLVAVVWGRGWISGVGTTSFLLFLSVGLGYTLWSEYFNVHLIQSWAYSRWMPTIFGIGLVPLLQWIVVPTAVVWLTRSVR